MTARPTRRQQFSADARAITDYYAAEAGPGVALRFVDELEITVHRIARNPGIGSSRYGDLGISGLRSLAMTDFPFVIFFVAGERQVTLLRVLHGRRDIPSIL